MKAATSGAPHFGINLVVDPTMSFDAPCFVERREAIGGGLEIIVRAPQNRREVRIAVDEAGRVRRLFRSLLGQRQFAAPFERHSRRYRPGYRQIRLRARTSHRRPRAIAASRSSSSSDSAGSAGDGDGSDPPAPGLRPANCEAAL